MSGYDSGNIFAKILRGDIPAKKRFENDGVIAFDDVSPAAPVHVLVIPKGEYTDFGDFCAKAGEERVAAFFAAVREIAENVLGLRENGYRLIMNTGADASQTVFHFHAHILAGRPLGALVPGDALTR